jgi:RsiW-degrading membrane proteinase PrsW (M82 family)
MDPHFLVTVLIGLVPVVMFLGVLLYFDSYRLITPSEMIVTLVSGLLLAGAGYFSNGWLLDITHLPFERYTWFVSPSVEEMLKASVIVLMFARNRVGFMIDAAIMGFAVGTGFALFENTYYLYIFQDAEPGTWIVRGFGTAIMHGGTTAIFAMLSQSLIERRGSFNPLFLLPGLIVAILVHTVFNVLEGTPMIATMVVVVGLPPMFYFIFAKNEFAVHQWLVKDYESHQQLLDEINSGDFTHSEAGRFILGLTVKFSKAIVDRMFEYLKLHTQLVLRAEQITAAREKNEKLQRRPQDHDDLVRLETLEKEIGRSAMMTLWPHLHFSRRELWEIHHLHDEVA